MLHIQIQQYLIHVSRKSYIQLIYNRQQCNEPATKNDRCQMWTHDPKSKTAFGLQSTYRWWTQLQKKHDGHVKLHICGNCHNPPTNKSNIQSFHVLIQINHVANNPNLIISNQTQTIRQQYLLTKCILSLIYTLSRYQINSGYEISKERKTFD